MHRLLRGGQRTGTPGDGFGGARRAGWGARPGPRRGQAPPLAPVDAPSARPVRTVPAIVCGGCLLGRIVLAVSNLPRPLSGHSRGPRAGPLPSARAPRQSWQTGRPARRSHPTFQKQPPTQPPSSLRRAPGSRPREGGTSPPPSHLDCFPE